MTGCSCCLAREGIQSLLFPLLSLCSARNSKLLTSSAWLFITGGDKGPEGTRQDVLEQEAERDRNSGGLLRKRCSEEEVSQGAEKVKLNGPGS